MSADEARLCAIAHEFARIARAAAPRLPREVVDDAAQEAWVRWLKACNGKGEEALAVHPVAFLVGIFRHVCADAVRAHRRRQLRYLLAADASAEAFGVTEATQVRVAGGAWTRSSTRSCDHRSPDCLRPTSKCGLPPRSTASVGSQRARQRGWTDRRSSARGEESPDSCPPKACSDDSSNGWTMFRDGHGVGAGSACMSIAGIAGFSDGLARGHISHS